MLSSLLDILLPGNCPLCHGASLITHARSSPCREETGGLCTNCLAGMKKITSPLCTLCGAPFVSPKGADHLCALCSKIKREPFIKARSALYYSGVTSTAIKLFKYHGHFTLKPAFSAFLYPLLHEFKDIDLIIPVPLHKKRLRHRGFNQSLMLARIVSKNLKKELDYTSLKRTRLTRPQTELKGEARKRNVRGAFEVNGAHGGGALYKDKKVLLIDDVYTTGATITECARVLKRAGARVSALTLARTARV